MKGFSKIFTNTNSLFYIELQYKQQLRDFILKLDSSEIMLTEIYFTSSYPEKILLIKMDTYSCILIAN